MVSNIGCLTLNTDTPHRELVCAHTNCLELCCYQILEICKDEEGGTLLINDNVKGWNVSPCLSCHCKGGLTTCKRDLTINFPGYFRGMYSLEQNCSQPSCSVLKFVQENKDWCHGKKLRQQISMVYTDYIELYRPWKIVVDCLLQ